MNKYSRRYILKGLFYGGSAALLGGCGGDSSSTLESLPSPDSTPNPVPIPDPLALDLPLGAGPLYEIGELVTSDVDDILLPEGFSIRRVARYPFGPVSGDSVFGYKWHVAPDGGAVFPVDSDGGWVYVSNSEDTNNGGVGALRFDKEGNILKAYRILDDTRRNCAGGSTPWGTWLSCEEVSDGQVYECDPMGTPETARVLPALGRFNHEAAVVDKLTRTVYLSEDSGSGRLYRFVSAGEASSINGVTGLDLDNGILQVMEVEGFESGGYMESLSDARQVRKVRWVDAFSPDQPQGEVRAEIETTTGNGAPGTCFKGGEGLWVHEIPETDRPMISGAEHPMRAVVFFSSKGDNRVYALDIDNDLFEMVFDNEQLDGVSEPFDDVDNVTVSPAGDVIVAEDGDAMRLMVVAPNLPPKIMLQVPGGDSELTGPAFTPDGSRLYFSSQRGPSNGLLFKNGVTYELMIPPEFRGS